MPTTYQDISRKSTNVILDPEVSSEIISKAIDESAVMQLAQRMQVAGNGKKFQMITGDPTPEWVAETNAKPVGSFAFGVKEVTPYKMALIVPFSDEFRRDKKALYDECVGRMPKLFGRKLDATVMSNASPGTGFDVLGGCDKMSILPQAASGSTPSTDVYDRFLAVDAKIGAADGIMNGIALAPQGRSIVLAAKDGDGRPLFTPGVQSGQLGNILGAGVSVRKGVYVPGTPASGSGSSAVEGTPATVGVAGDWDNISWGAVEAIQGSISNEASISYDDGSGNTVTINLWQQNMFAIRFEIELAVMVRYPETFALLTGAVPAAA